MSIYVFPSSPLLFFFIHIQFNFLKTDNDHWKKALWMRKCVQSRSFNRQIENANLASCVDSPLQICIFCLVSAFALQFWHFNGNLDLIRPSKAQLFSWTSHDPLNLNCTNPSSFLVNNLSWIVQKDYREVFSLHRKSIWKLPHFKVWIMLLRVVLILDCHSNTNFLTIQYLQFHSLLIYAFRTCGWPLFSHFNQQLLVFKSHIVLLIFSLSPIYGFFCLIVLSTHSLILLFIRLIKNHTSCLFIPFCVIIYRG